MREPEGETYLKFILAGSCGGFKMKELATARERGGNPKVTANLSLHGHRSSPFSRRRHIARVPGGWVPAPGVDP